MGTALLRFQYLRDREGDPRPVLFFGGEATLSAGCDAVILSAVAGRRFAPVTDDVAVLLEPVEGRKERPRPDVKRATRHLMDPIRSTDAVPGFERQDLEHEQIGRALEQVGLLSVGISRHGRSYCSSISDIDIDQPNRVRSTCQARTLAFE